MYMTALTIDLSTVIHLTDDELFRLCQANQELRIERTKTGELIVMSPAGSSSGSKNAEITAQLHNWNRRLKSGVVFDSSAGFTLPNGAMRAPDAAWIRLERWTALSKAQQDRFAPICPDFIIELMSPSDSLKSAQEKMNEWMENGCKLAWLLNPQTQMSYIYREDKPVEIVQGFDKMRCGKSLSPEFFLDLSELR